MRKELSGMFPKDFHPETRYFYNRMNHSEKRFYEFLVERIVNLEFEFFCVAYEDSIPNDERSRSLPRFVLNLYEEEKYDYLCASLTFTRLIWDCPEFFYVNLCELVCKVGEPYVIGTGVSPYTPEEIAHYNAKLEDIIHRFDGIDDPYELELAVHDFIAESYSYEYDDERLSGQEFDEIFTVVGFLKRGRAVCEAYTDLAQLILQRRGIPCVHMISHGKPDDDKDHAWLAVKLDGEYYHLDITHNDSEDSPEIGLNHRLFNVTDEEIYDEDRVLYRDYYPDVFCTATKYNYFVKNGLLFDSLDSLKSALNEKLRMYRGTGERILFEFKVALPLGSDIMLVNNTVYETLGDDADDSCDGYTHGIGHFIYSLVFTKK